LPEALWAYRETWINTIGHTPYELVYGKKVLLPIEFQVKIFKTTIQLRMDLNEAQKKRLLQLNDLDDIRHDSLQITTLINGMTIISKRSPFSQVIGPSYMIVGSKILRVNCLLYG